MAGVHGENHPLLAGACILLCVATCCRFSARRSPAASRLHGSGLLPSRVVRGYHASSSGARQGALSPTQANPPSLLLTTRFGMAQASEPAYVAATAASRTAGLDKSIALAGLLPNVSYNNQGLYTEPNGAHGQVGQISDTPDLPKFIANNGVREYFSQGVVNETLGLAPLRPCGMPMLWRRWRGRNRRLRGAGWWLP